MCLFLRMQSLRNGLILVLEVGCIPLYLVKVPFWGQLLYSLLFCFNIFVYAELRIKKKKKKKSQPLFYNILGRSEKGKQTSVFFRPNIYHVYCGFGGTVGT